MISDFQSVFCFRTWLIDSQLLFVSCESTNCILFGFVYLTFQLFPKSVLKVFEKLFGVVGWCDGAG